MNLAIWLAYDGTRYDGWQKQGNTERTIQGRLEGVLERFAGEPVEVHGSGRTDGGVHAEGQVAHFHLKGICDPKELLDYMNRYLPEDIAVLRICPVPERFHSRLCAVEKTYRYQIETGPKKDVFQRRYYYGLGQELDIGKMEAAAGFLIGTHDFKSFCGNKKMKKSTVRSISSIRIQRQGSKIFLFFTGNGFLQQMVRILTGTLIEVGLGKRPADDIKRILEEKDRRSAGFTAPPEGLFLQNVKYEEEI